MTSAFVSLLYFEHDGLDVERKANVLARHRQHVGLQGMRACFVADAERMHGFV